MAGLLHHLSLHPHAVVIETLHLLQHKVLAPSQGLPGSVRAEAFSDTGLLQASGLSILQNFSAINSCNWIFTVKYRCSLSRVLSQPKKIV